MRAVVPLAFYNNWTDNYEQRMVHVYLSFHLIVYAFKQIAWKESEKNSYGYGITKV